MPSPPNRKGRDGPHQESKGPGWGRFLLRRWRRNIFPKTPLRFRRKRSTSSVFFSTTCQRPTHPPISSKKAALQNLHDFGERLFTFFHIYSLRVRDALNTKPLCFPAHPVTLRSAPQGFSLVASLFQPSSNRALEPLLSGDGVLRPS